MNTSIKKSLTLFLRVVIVLIGISALTLMLWEPHLEGRNANATLFQIYFNDPFLVYAYTVSIAFFILLYQAFKFVGYVGQNEIFSEASMKALRTIKYCALLTAGAIVAADIFLMIAAQSNGEDAAGAIALGIIATFIFVVIATAAAIFQKSLRTISDVN